MREPMVVRFWAKVKKTGGCWLWLGKTDKDGYGCFSHHKRAHRASYEIANGPFAADLCVLHSCDNPPCVNPDHLFLGTHADNVADRHAKGRSARLTRNPENAPRGVSVRSARLTDEVVLEIRRRYRAGEHQRPLAREFGVTQSTVGKAVRGRNWKHVGGPITTKPENPWN